MPKFWIALLVLLVSVTVPYTWADDFPSLLSANASIAIILDREYLDDKYESVVDDMKVIVEKVLREDLKNGGLIVSYYSWTKINLKKDFSAIYSITNCENTWELFREARRESLLLMALTDPDCPRLPGDKALMIPILKNGEELPQVITDLKTTQALQWKSTVVLHDDTFDRDLISRAVMALSKDSVDGYFKPTTVSMFKIAAVSHEWERRKNIRRTLTQIPTQFVGRNFLAIVTTKIMEDLIEISKDVGLVDPFSQWLYVVSDSSSAHNNMTAMSAMIGEGNNIALVYNMTKAASSCSTGLKCHGYDIMRAFVLGLSRMIREEKSVYGQISDEEWEVIRPTKQERCDDILESVKDYLLQNSKCDTCLNWQVDSGEIWGNAYVQNAFGSNEVTPTSTKSNLINVGMWNPTAGLVMTDVLFPHKSHGFRGRNFHIISYNNPPWQILTQNETGIAGKSRGLIIDILDEISKKLNFTYVLHIATSTVNTHLNLNSSDEANATFSEEVLSNTNIVPTEITHLLMDNRILIAAVGATVTNKLKQHVNFTIPISIQAYNFLVSRPHELSRIFLFMSPFTTGTWLCLGLAIVGLSPLLYLVNRYSPFYQHESENRRIGLGKMGNCFWYIYGALLQQGGMYLPRADSGRIIIGTWWLVVIVLVTTYCGNLVAFLTFPKMEVPVTSINQLVKLSDKLTWGLKAATYLEDFLKESDEPKHQTLIRHATSHDELTGDIVERVREGKHVYIDWRMNLLYIMKNQYLQTDHCDFALADDNFLEEQIALLMPKGSVYLQLFNEEIKRLHQMGFIELWFKEYLPKRDRCWKSSSNLEATNHIVNLDDMQGSFLVLLLGFVGGILLIVVECLVFRWLRRREKAIITPYTE